MDPERRRESQRLPDGPEGEVIRDRKRVYIREWHAANPGKKHEYNLRKYGLTPRDYQTLVERQAGKCAICRTADPGSGASRWHVDHDHATGKVRGLLCAGCNTGIGKLRDDPQILDRAAAYLRAHGK